MSSKPKTSVRLEVEIDKCREESNWKKAQELAEQLGLRGGGLADPLTTFYIGESKLEQHLEEYPPSEQNVNKARGSLTEAKRLLQACLNDGQRCGITVDGHFLLAKLLYAQGYYEEALNHLSLGRLDELSEKQLKTRLLKIVAESFAIKGFCLEKLPLESTSKYKASERDETILSCLIRAGDLALRYLQELEKMLGQTGGTLPQLVSGNTGLTPPVMGITPNTEFRIGAILETALQKAPLLYIQKGDMMKAINQYRNVLSSVETSSTHSLRQTMSRQLAEVLLRGVCETAYQKFLPILENKNSGSPWKPKKYTGQTLFLPKDENEEVLLLLFISEAMAVRNAVLDRSQEFKENRVHSYHNVTAVYDLLTIGLTRRNQASVLAETFERAMKFAFEEFHVWFQFALSLISNGKYLRAHLVLTECARFQPSNGLPLLLAARLCYEHLGQPEEGMRLSSQALDRELSHWQAGQPQPQPFQLAKCYLMLGIGYELMSEQARPQTLKQQLRGKAFEAFIRAQTADPCDHLVEFYLALHYAEARQIPEAINHCRTALLLRPEHIHSLHLMVLLLSAQKQYNDALHLLDAALDEYPENLNLLFTKAHLEEQCLSADVALLTSKQMLQKWRTLYEGQLKNEFQDENLHRVASDTRSLFQVYSSELSDRDSGSPAGNSMAAVSRVEHALSEVASSVGGFQPKPGPQAVWMLQLQIWLLIGDLYLSLGQLGDAEACIQEASSIFPLSHQLMVLKGLIHEFRKEFYEAKNCFQNAVSINPVHVKALQHLGLVYHYLGSSHLGEKTLRDAVTIDPLNHQSWYNIGQILQDMGDFESASDCLATAIELEATNPILPFSYIPRTME